MKNYIIDPLIEKCMVPLDEERRQELRISLQERGFEKEYPLIIWKGHDTIVDGHHRYWICKELGIEPIVSEVPFETIEDVIVYAIDHQTSRRNLTVGQITIVAMTRYEAEEKIKARNRQSELNNRDAALLTPHAEEAKGTSAAIIATKAGVKPHNVYEVRAVRKKGIPEVERMVMHEGLHPSTANEFVQRTSKDLQSEIVKGGVDAVKLRAREIREEREAKQPAVVFRTEQEKFKELNRCVDQTVAEKEKIIDAMFGGSNHACFLPNVSELWCEDCQWGFDVYLPPPFDPKCPYCGGLKLTKRIETWYPKVM